MAINDRRVIFSTYVVPTRSDTMEEDSVSHTTFQTSPGGTLGGKGIAEIHNTQWGDGWTSFSHMNENWEDWDTDTADLTGNRWEYTQELWDGTQTITTNTVLTTASGKVGFLYVKNTGDTNDLELSLEGSTYNILIPPGGAVSIRPNIAYVDMAEVKVQCGSGTTCEYIIASEA